VPKKMYRRPPPRPRPVVNCPPPPPRPTGCPPGYVPRSGGGYMPMRPTYPQGYGSRGYPERGTSWNRNGQGYTPVNGYTLPHPSGYLPLPFPFQTGGYGATSSAAPQQMRRAPVQQIRRAPQQQQRQQRQRR
jgi:hypothetical protein